VKITSEDLKKIEDKVVEIRSLAIKMRMGTDLECRCCLKEIINLSSSVLNLLNDPIMDEVELSR